jgi:hypothetical protein
MLTNKMVVVNGFLAQKYSGIDKAGWGSVNCDRETRRYVLSQSEGQWQVRDVSPNEGAESLALKKEISVRGLPCDRIKQVWHGTIAVTGIQCRVEATNNDEVWYEWNNCAHYLSGHMGCLGDLSITTRQRIQEEAKCFNEVTLHEGNVVIPSKNWCDTWANGQRVFDWEPMTAL